MFLVAILNIIPCCLQSEKEKYCKGWDQALLELHQGQSWTCQPWKQGPRLQSGCLLVTILSLHPKITESLSNATSGLFPPWLLVWCGRIWWIVAGTSFCQDLQKGALKRFPQHVLLGFREAKTLPKDDRKGCLSLLPLDQHTPKWVSHMSLKS